MDWREIRIDGVARIDRVVGIFEITLAGKLPFVSFKIKVTEGAQGDFVAISNVWVKDQDGFAHGEAGLGPSLEKALEDCLTRFLAETKSRKELRNEDFVWKTFEEF